MTLAEHIFALLVANDLQLNAKEATDAACPWDEALSITREGLKDLAELALDADLDFQIAASDYMENAPRTRDEEPESKVE